MPPPFFLYKGIAMLKGWGVPALLFVTVLIIRPHIAGAAFPFAQGLLLIPVLVGLAIILLSRAEAGDASKNLLPALLLPWVLAGWSLITLFWAPDPGQGLREFISLLGSITVFSAAYWLMRREKEFGNGSLLIPGIILIPVLANAVYQRMFGLAHIRETMREMAATGELVVRMTNIIADNRVFAGFLNPNMLAGFLGMGICLTLDQLLTAGQKKHFFFFAFLTGGQCVVLILTGSVGGSMVAVAMAGAVLLIRREFRARDLVLAGAVILIISIGILAIRGGGFLFGPESSLVQRGGYMAAGIRMALIHPVLGWGSGSSPGALMGFVAEGIRPVADPHNFLVRAWISWGLPGVMILLAFLAFWSREVYGLFKTMDGHSVPAGYAGFVFGALAFFGHSLLDMDFFVPETALFGWCFLGAALGLAGTRMEEKPTGSLRPPNHIKFATGGAVLMLVLPVFIFMQGESLAFRANKAVGQGEFITAADLYKSARGMIPFSGRFALEEGRARMAAGDMAAARELFQRADSLMKASPYPSWELARAAQAAGKWKDSIPLLEKVLLRYDTSPRVRIDLAMAYLNLGEREQAYGLLKDARHLSAFDLKSREIADEILSMIDKRPPTHN